MRPVRPGRPHAQVSTERLADFLKRSNRITTSATAAATKGIMRDMAASSGGVAEFGTIAPVKTESGRRAAPGYAPKRMQTAAIIPSAKFMFEGAAAACLAASLLGLPKNVIPYNLTKQEQARALVRATAPMSKGTAGLGSRTEPWSRDWKIS